MSKAIAWRALTYRSLSVTYACITTLLLFVEVGSATTVPAVPPPSPIAPRTEYIWTSLSTCGGPFTVTGPSPTAVCQDPRVAQHWDCVEPQYAPHFNWSSAPISNFWVCQAYASNFVPAGPWNYLTVGSAFGCPNDYDLRYLGIGYECVASPSARICPPGSFKLDATGMTCSQPGGASDSDKNAGACPPEWSDGR